MKFMRSVGIVVISLVVLAIGVMLPREAAARPTLVCLAGSSVACPIRISLLRGTYGTTVHGRLTQIPTVRSKRLVGTLDLARCENRVRLNELEAALEQPQQKAA